MFVTVTSTIARAVLGTVGTAVCAGLCLAGATVPAHADTVRSTTVSYADLDLTHRAGRATLDQRVRLAAQSVCASGDTGLAARASESQCVRTAIRDARRPRFD